MRPSRCACSNAPDGPNPQTWRTKPPSTRNVCPVTNDESPEQTASYLMGEPLVSDYLEEGLSQFGFSCAEFEIGRL